MTDQATLSKPADVAAPANRADARYVEIANLIKEYPNPVGDPVRVVDRFNLNIRKGEVISVIGHSGCGKSTVLTMVAGLNAITDGDVIVAEQQISGPGPDRAVVFQAPCLSVDDRHGNVMLGVKRAYPTATKAERTDICRYYLSQVGLADAMDKYPVKCPAVCNGAWALPAPSP